ncbi:MAG: peptidoglycan recognition family protein [archaeon]|nr:peptidoglycan recognition protein family protein [Nanoarchaeota archaeon]
MHSKSYNRRQFLLGSGAVIVSTAIPIVGRGDEIPEDYSTPRVLSRSQWSARPAKYDPKWHYYDNRNVIEYLVIHHTATIPDLGTNPTVWSIQDAHMGSKGYLDIAYNEVIAKNGWCYMGRDWQTMGAAVGPSIESQQKHKTYGYLIHPQRSLNYGTYNICLIGDFTLERPEDKQVEMLLERIITLADQFPNITPERIIGHKDAKIIANARGVRPSKKSMTLCPGNIDDVIGKCRKTLENYRKLDLSDNLVASLLHS